MRGVAGCRQDADSGNDLLLSAHDLEAPRGADRLPVIREIARRGSFVGVRRPVQLALLHDVARVAEAQPDLTALVLPRVAAGMVEMQVAVDDERNVVHRKSELREPLL